MYGIEGSWRASRGRSGASMRAPALTLLLLVASACGSCHSGDGADSSYAARYARAVCGVLGPCCSDNGLGFDHDGCVLGGAGFVQSGVDRAVAAGATLDTEAADACITGAVRLTKSCQPIASDPAVAAACARVFVGHGKPGAACSTDFDCERSKSDHGACQNGSLADGGAASGICVLRVAPAVVGDGCLAPRGGPFTVADCEASGLYCNVGSRACAEKQPPGAACGLLLPCAPGTHCDAGGHCAATLAAGEACTSDASCSSQLCLRGHCARNFPGSLAPCTGQSP